MCMFMGVCDEMTYEAAGVCVCMYVTYLFIRSVFVTWPGKHAIMRAKIYK